MSQELRLASDGRITRANTLKFTFNGKTYYGVEGDTLASALLANGVKVVTRSFKYHRPRGIVGSGAEEPNAILQIGTGATTVPNIRATQQELYDGLVARSINAWPSLENDLGAIMGKLGGRLFPAGFYYKTFMWPKNFWLKYEHVIRKAAGLGLAPDKADPDRYDKTNAHCDVLVVGAGPAGLSAALAAAKSGARVILADEQAELGGSLLSSRADIGGETVDQYLAHRLSELQGMSEVTLLPRSTVTGYYDHNFLIINQRLTHHMAKSPANAPRERMWRVRARQVVLATGAIERSLVFGNNDWPGVMQASAVSTYINRYAVAPGKRAVVFTNNNSAYQTALDMDDAGIKVVAVVDARSDPLGELPQQVSARGINIETGSVVTSVEGDHSRISMVKIMRLGGSDADPEVTGAAGSLGCDFVAVSGGWSPAVHLHAQSGARPVFDDKRACYIPGTSVQAERSAGSSNATWALSDCLAEGFQAGLDAARETGLEPTSEAPMQSSGNTNQSDDSEILPLWLVPGLHKNGQGPKKFVDFQNDTTAADLELAVREGFKSIEHVKRYTALGFGTDQGKLGNINGMAIVAKALGQTLPETGTTTFRPNYTPVTFGAIAGRELGDTLFDPVRKTAMHYWHAENGAEFEDVGQWKRPWYYPKSGEGLYQAVNRECLATRESIGIMDASTLGKIDIVGPDAVDFLNRIYTNAWNKLAIGRCRYGLMLGEDGMVMDDGVTTRLGESHFHMTTTTGGAANVMTWMERWLQTEWPELRVYLTSVTDQWAVASIAGPNSRKLIESVCHDVDFSNDAFPFMSYQTGTVAGIPARLFRISFSGELAYEINVPANYGRHLWQALMAAGESYNITPYGTETMHVLRAEKGYIIVGQDTDGSMTPQDLGMDWICSKKKDYIGRRSLFRSDTVRENRKQLVGLKPHDPAKVLPEGAQLVNEPSSQTPVPMEGHVTSSYFSPSLGHSIALAVVKGGHSRMGNSLFASLMDGSNVAVTICEPVFYDPKGERQQVESPNV